MLLVRGELLRRYPTTTIYAARATAAGALDATTRLAPMFRGALAPDIVFVGFALSEESALGIDPPGPGWYFVFEQYPGEPRFGFDEVAAPGVPSTPDALAWAHVPVTASGHADVTQAAAAAAADLQARLGQERGRHRVADVPAAVPVAMHASRLIAEEQRMTDLAAIAAARAKRPGGRGRRARARRPARRRQGRPRSPARRPRAAPAAHRRAAAGGRGGAGARGRGDAAARDGLAAQASAAEARAAAAEAAAAAADERSRAGASRTCIEHPAGGRRASAVGCSPRRRSASFDAERAAITARQQARRGAQRRRRVRSRRSPPPTPSSRPRRRSSPRLQRSSPRPTRQLADARNRQAAVEALPAHAEHRHRRAAHARHHGVAAVGRADRRRPRRDRAAAAQVAAATSPAQAAAATAELERLRAELVAGDNPDDLAALVATDLPLALLPVRLETRFDASNLLVRSIPTASTSTRTSRS